MLCVSGSDSETREGQESGSKNITQTYSGIVYSFHFGGNMKFTTTEAQLGTKTTELEPLVPVVTVYSLLFH